MCLACAREDMATLPHLSPDAAIACRLDTIAGMIRTCHRHDLSFVQIADKDTMGEHRGDYSLAVSDAWELMSEYEFTVSRRAPSDAEIYFIGRIGILPGIPCPLLDAMEMGMAARVCQTLGVYAEKGPKGKQSGLNEDELQSVMQTGYSIVAAGEEGLRKMVQTQHANMVRPGRELGAARLLGKLRHLLQISMGRDLDPLRQLIVDIISELEPLGPDDPKVFGVSPVKRHWHTLESASRTYGLSARTILGDLKRSGTFGVRKGARTGDHKISACTLEALYRSRDALLGQVRLFELTGIRNRYLSAFEEAGLIGRAGRHGEKRYSALFRRGAVDDLIDRINGVAPTVSEAPSPDYVTLVDAYLESDWTLPEVLMKIVNEEVAAVQLPGLPMFDALLVDLFSLKRLHPFFGKDHMSVEEVAELLAIGETAVSRLAHHQILPFARTRSGLRHSRLRRSILREHALEFAKRYITVAEIWRAGIPMIKVRKWLDSLGLRRVPFPPDVRCTFYLRNEVEPQLPNWTREFRSPD
ncbi:hypothetical protein GCM10010862_38100 [Devosia nitrariae]|uniref:Uncharacterized protein n=2 Tax=Devosia nitrariae TaxID=2071872 RepID=A0ABQ5WA88_9HYPH|nr:hypothetical protein GCM10010862_38100 [Devosia nitrariae]